MWDKKSYLCTVFYISVHHNHKYHVGHLIGLFSVLMSTVYYIVFIKNFKSQITSIVLKNPKFNKKNVFSYGSNTML